MAKSILDIVIRFAKEGDADRDTVKALQNVKVGITDTIATMTILAGTAAVVAGAYVKLVGVFEDYALQVTDLSRLTGASMEETSRMIQVADDMRVSYESLQKALWFASKSGVEVNIESLGRLADQYNSLNSATEQATFLSKTFGMRNGAEMGKLLAIGSAGINQLSEGMQENLILTAESRQKALEYSIAIDTMNDALYGAKVALGQDLIGPLTDFINGLTDMARAIDIVTEAGGNWVYATAAEKQAALEQAAAVREADAALKMHQETLENDTAATDAAKAAQDALKQAFSDLSTAISGDLGKAEDDHLAKLDELSQKLAEARSPKEKGELQAQIDAETAAYERQTNAILYNIQSQIIMRTTAIADEEKLGILTALAEGYGLIDAKTRGAVDATNALVSAYLNQSIGADEFVDRLRGQTEEVKKLTSGVQEGADRMGSMHGNTKNVTQSAEDSIDPLDTMSDSLAGVRDTAGGAAGEVHQVIAQMKQLDGMVAVVTIVINTIGDMPSFGKSGPGQNVAQCFAGKTPVLMGDSSHRPIRDVHVGDTIWSREPGGQLVETTVARTFRHEVEIGSGAVLLEIGFEGRPPGSPLRVTPEHKLFVNGQWMPAGQVRLDDEFLTELGQAVRVVSILRGPSREPVFNLETDHETHNYFAGGVLVHNGKAAGMSQGGQWVPGMWALVGDMPGGGIGPYTEAIDPWGYIHSASETRRLASMGLLNGAVSLYIPEDSGAYGGSNMPNRHLKDPDLTGSVNQVRSESEWLGGTHPMESGGATLSSIMAPMAESAAAAGQAARAAAMASDRQAEQSVLQTDAIRSSNAQVIEKLDELLRVLPDAMQDSVKLIGG